MKIKIPNLCQVPQSSSEALNQDLEDMDILCTFKIKIEIQYWEHGYIKDQWQYTNQDQDVKHQTSPPVSPKVLNQDLKEMDILCTFKINIESQYL